MTIDMLRHTSLREIVARALYDPPPVGRNLAGSHRSARRLFCRSQLAPRHRSRTRRQLNGGYCRSGPGANAPPRCQGLESPCPQTSPRLHAALARGSA